MTEQNLITPPPELMTQWSETWHKAQFKRVSHVEFVTTQAARWGADQELEACVKWIEDCGYHPSVHEDLCATRRPPKPPSLKKRALSEIADSVAEGNISPGRGATIRLALEALPND
jgi:hypothetical protein